MFGVALGATYLAVRSGEPEAPTTRSAPKPESTRERARAPTVATLRAKRAPESTRFPQALARDPANARLFTELADTSTDPREIEAALRAIPFVYASRPTPRRPGPDAELERVLAKHVASETPAIALAALEAAAVPLMAKEPGAALTNAIVDLADADQPTARRYAALEALNRLRPNRRGDAVLAAFDRALAANEPHLVSLALLALATSGPALEATSAVNRDALAARVLELGRHADPGVRGHALFVLAELAWLLEPRARLEAARDHRDDRHPLVRAHASALAARCDQPMAIHWLIGLVADLEPARYALTGWTQLDGTPGTLVHTLPGRSRVADAALFALQSLAQRVEGARPLRLTLGGRAAPDALVEENAATARAWYQAERARVPREFIENPHTSASR